MQYRTPLGQCSQRVFVERVALRALTGDVQELVDRRLQACDVRVHPFVQLRGRTLTCRVVGERHMDAA
ncbi:hypothetical protein WKI65_43795 [Streptomyces sp. MS1.AVA.3]|uniref:hypothetical protein n=1 Tax=Streptomyces decoyicus TaxID=249567 RepID=UPI0030BFF9DE